MIATPATVQYIPLSLCFSFRTLSLFPYPRHPSLLLSVSPSLSVLTGLLSICLFICLFVLESSFLFPFSDLRHLSLSNHLISLTFCLAFILSFSLSLSLSLTHASYCIYPHSKSLSLHCLFVIVLYIKYSIHFLSPVLRDMLLFLFYIYVFSLL